MRWPFNRKKQLEPAVRATEPVRPPPPLPRPDGRPLPDNLTSLPDGAGQKVVGESKYQDALRFLAGGRAAGDDLGDHFPARALLVPEPDNQWDRDAVRVDLIMGQHTYEVGYLPRTIADQYQPTLLLIAREGDAGTCEAFITGGGDKLYGVYLHLGWPRDLAKFALSKYVDTAEAAPAEVEAPPQKRPAVAGTPAPENLTELPDGGNRGLGVVGESHYQKALRMLAEGKVIGDDFEQHLPALALLVPEPDNKWDHHAVRVDLIKDGRAYKVGYIPGARAGEYQPELLFLKRAGFAGTCRAYITGGGRDRHYGVYLHVAFANNLRLYLRREFGVVVEERDGLALLHADWTYTVTKKEQHQDVLQRHAPEPGADSREVVATLGFCDITTGKYKGQKAIEVGIDGDRVGQLTPTTSFQYAEVVSGLLDRGLTPACTAHVSAGDKGLEVTVSVPDGRLYT
jgi:hypothetical protein